MIELSDGQTLDDPVIGPPIKWEKVPYSNLVGTFDTEDEARLTLSHLKPYGIFELSCDRNHEVYMIYQYVELIRIVEEENGN